METQAGLAQHQLRMVMQHTRSGLVEIDSKGDISYLNLRAEALLKPVRVAYGITGNNLHPVLEVVAPSIVEKIKSSPDSPGNILINELHSFSLCFGEENVERHFNFTVTRLSAHCIIVDFDDLTEMRLKEKAITQLTAEKAIEQGKFEIASNVLHDIGNAMVGFGSYLSRIKRAQEHSHPDSLQKLSEFFETQQSLLVTVLGEVKSDAVVKMVQGMARSQRKNYDEIDKSVKEQLNIISHIQEILMIQRQYLNGRPTVKKTQTDLRTIVKDCMSMLLASVEKKAIRVSIDIPISLPKLDADHTGLMQVVLNLLKNSIEAFDVNAEEKRIAICAKLKDHELILELRDTGHGFDEATGKQLFVRGFSTKASGTGLGLPNCRSIIESHYGSIDMTSGGYGKGATTIIRFKI